MAGRNKKKSSPVSAPKKRKGGFFHALLMIFLIIFMLGAVAASLGTAWYVNHIWSSLPSDEEMLTYQANRASTVYDRNGKVVTELFVENRKPIKLAECSKWMVMSILAAEDSEFYVHHGIRPTAIVRSILTGDRGQGASTITQQLARNLFLTSIKTLDRKAREAIIALRLERLFTKDTLLETYLNAIYFGHGTWGIDAAAHGYFNKSAADLDLAEASTLAGLVAAPELYSPIRHPGKSKVRQNYVLGRMVSLGWITQEEADKAGAEQLVFNKRTLANKLTLNKAPYFVSQILFKDLIPTYGSDRVYKGGLKIYTTLDIELQEAAEKAMKSMKSEGALVALNPSTGAVMALVGGKDFSETKFNRVTQAYRQSGSAFKPILYATALNEGYRPIDHIMDEPVTIQVNDAEQTEWSPHNYSKDQYAGEETLLRALAKSHNTPVARLAYILGPDKVVKMARAMGITSPHMQAVYSIGLGIASVTPLELAVTYSTIANGGARVHPYYITEIRSADDRVIYSSLPSQEETVKRDVALMTRSMMQEVVRAGTGRRAKIKGYDTFGKTGTSNDFTDAWFAGGVPGLVTVVYSGNDDLKSLGNKATGGRIALPVWKEFMSEGVKIVNCPHKFPPVESNELTEMHVCVDSGFLATDECPDTTTILMPADRVPTAYCPLHGGSTVEAENDPNAPRLMLLEQDTGFVHVTETPELPDEPEISVPIPEPVPDSEVKKVEPEKVPDPSKSWREYIKKDNRSVDERYEELLKKYRIN